MSGFLDYFDRVVVINMPSRHDRRTRLAAHLADRGLENGILWQDAHDGRDSEPPDGWSAGQGAWGCLQSHCSALKQALADGVERLLLLEDDVVFSPHTAASLPRVMQALPDDWGQLYLGGQHLADPRSTASPLLWKATNINRTHAWACSRNRMPQIIQHLEQWDDYRRPAGATGWHLDHQLGAAHEKQFWPCLTTSWWLAGQEEDQSDVCAQRLRRRWWHHRRYAFFLPFVHLPENIEDGTAFYTCPEGETCEAIVSRPAALLGWLHTLAEKALDHGALPAWRSQALTADAIRAVWPAGVVRHNEAPSDYPFNGLFPHAFAS